MFAVTLWMAPALRQHQVHEYVILTLNRKFCMQGNTFLEWARADCAPRAPGGASASAGILKARLYSSYPHLFTLLFSRVLSLRGSILVVVVACSASLGYSTWVSWSWLSWHCIPVLGIPLVGVCPHRTNTATATACTSCLGIGIALPQQQRQQQQSVATPRGNGVISFQIRWEILLTCLCFAWRLGLFNRTPRQTRTCTVRY